MRAKLILFTTCVTIPLLSACTQPQDHRGLLVLPYVTTYTRALPPTHDFLALHQWREVLRRQPITTGRGKPTYNTLSEINAACNDKPYQITPAWPTPQQFKQSLSGDCKGFAICKYYALRKAGWQAKDLNMWVGAYNGHPHVMLVAALSSEYYVLDIGSESNLPVARDYFYNHFQPTYRFNETGWDTN